MTNRLLKLAVVPLAAAAMILPAAAAMADTVYDTVDAVAMQADRNIRITGVVVGATGPTTTSYLLLRDYFAERCERMALLAMSKPGKYQLTLVGLSGDYSCKLALRAP